MCDYSMHVCRTRDAEVGDVLEVASFFGTDTIGLRRVGDEHHLATCLQPGTFLEAAEVPCVTSISFGFFQTIRTLMRRKLPTEEGQVVRFVRLHEDEPNRHHDYLEWFTLHGKVNRVAITDLASGKFRVKLLPQMLKPGQIVDMSSAPPPTPSSPPSSPPSFASTSTSPPTPTPTPTPPHRVLEDA